MNIGQTQRESNLQIRLNQIALNQHISTFIWRCANQDCMRFLSTASLLRLCFVSALLLILLEPFYVLADGFRAGIAVRVVTPEPLLPVSGGVGPGNKATRKLGDLTVRAFVLESGATRVAIVSSDFLGFPAALGNQARAEVIGVPPENILIGATHTHSAPDCYGFPDGKGGTDADLEYLRTVSRKMAEAVNEAVRQLQPARLKIATGDARGKIAYNYYAPQLYDPRCHVIQAVDMNSKPFATLVNYAIHPEVLGAGQGVLSPDLIGPFCDRVRELGGGTAIFMNSAQGGMVTADCRGPDGNDIRTWGECVRIGNLLADEALRIVSTASVQENPAVYCAHKTIRFSVESPMLLAVMRASPLALATDESNTISTRLNVLNVGNAQILTIPGEALPNIGFYLKRKMRGEHNFLFGLTNDALGYILTKEDWGSFKRYDYVSQTCLGEMTGEILIEEALTLVNTSPIPTSSQ